MLARNGFFAHPVLQAGGGAESRFADTEGDGGTTPFPGPACERAEPATRTVCPFRLSHIRFAGDPCRLSRQGGRDSRAGTRSEEQTCELQTQKRSSYAGSAL